MRAWPDVLPPEARLSAKKQAWTQGLPWEFERPVGRSLRQRLQAGSRQAKPADRRAAAHWKWVRAQLRGAKTRLEAPRK